MDQWRAEAERWIEQLAADHSDEFFHALREVLDERFPRGPGRPKGSGDPEDHARLERLVELLLSGEESDKDEAVRRVAREDPGSSESNTRRRLYRKLPWVDQQLARPEEKEKAEILRRAFEEEVEQWDL